MISLKLSFDGELRRVSVDQDAVTYTNLLAIARQLFNIDPEGNKLSFAWCDDEGDLITLSSEEEMKEAARFMGSQKVFKFHVFRVGGTGPSRPQGGRKQSCRAFKPPCWAECPLFRNWDMKVSDEDKSKMLDTVLTTVTDIASAFRGDIGTFSSPSSNCAESEEEKKMMEAALRASMNVPSPTNEPTPAAVHIESPLGNPGVGAEEEKEEIFIMPQANVPEVGINSQESPSVIVNDSGASRCNANTTQHSTNITSSDIEMWSEELRVLADMGFHDVNILIPLLRLHCREPVSAQRNVWGNSAKINSIGIERVLHNALAMRY